MRHYLFILFLISNFLASHSFAKKVSIQWKEISGAVRYELLIQSEQGKTLKKIIEKSEWSGDVPAGPYVYRVRAIDRIKRPGGWSEPKALVVMPPPPELESPASGEVIHSFKKTQKIKIKWNEVNGAKKYRLDIKREDQKILSLDCLKNEVEIPNLGMGKYQWQVRAILEAPESFPESLKNKKWESAASELSHFALEKKELEAPSQITPKGSVWMPLNGKINLQWEKVNGADGYEVILASADSLTDVKRYKTANDAVIINIPKEGKYQWKVHALSGEEAGPQSMSDFKLERDLDSTKIGAGYFATSTMLAPYQYQHESPTNGQRVEAGSQALTLRLSGEYWHWKSLALSGSFDNTAFVVNQRNFNRLTYEFGLKFNRKLGQERYGWFFAPKISFEGRDYFALLLSDPNNSTSLQSTKISVLGMAVGFDLRRQFSARWSLGVRAAYYIPFSVFGASSPIQIASNSSYRNMNLGAQGLYWMSRSWGLGMGVYLDQRSIGYHFASTPALDAETVVMDAVYFFGSLVYTFGQ